MSFLVHIGRSAGPDARRDSRDDCSTPGENWMRLVPLFCIDSARLSKAELRPFVALPGKSPGKLACVCAGMMVHSFSQPSVILSRLKAGLDQLRKSNI
jgi:hypothetical protein